jgi:rhodanese-related sulfurtransferase
MNKKNLSLIILISVITGFLYNFLSKDGLPLIRKEIQIEYVSDSTFNSFHNGTENGDLAIKGLNLDQTYKLYTNRMAVFIDARDQWEYGEIHIAGSINIPEFSFEPDDPSVTDLSKDQLYVIYCDGDDCDVSKRLAAELTKIGFKKVYVFLGGIYEWIDAGYPTEGDKAE